MTERRSPWWFRRRGTLIGLVYALGFFFGYLSIDGPPSEPAFVRWGARLGSSGAATVIWCAIASALVAWLLRAAGTAYLRSDVVFAADVQSDKLIVAGVFRYVRNPLYLGNVFLAIAVGVLAPPLGFALIVLGNAVLSVLLAGEESREMAQRYGATYEAFRAAVPAFIPRFTPATVPGSVTVAPAWGAGLLSEAFCLALALALVPIALYGLGGLRAFWAIWLPAMVGFAAAGWWAGRRRTQS